MSNLSGMKVFQVLVAYLVIALLLGWGIYHTAKGSFGPLAISVIAFAIAFGKLGCLPPPEHH